MLPEKILQTDSSGRPLKQLNTLHALLQITSKSAGQNQMLHEVLDILREQMGMCRGVFMLSTPDGRELVVEAASEDEKRSEANLVRYQRGEVMEKGHFTAQGTLDAGKTGFFVSLKAPGI
jgi:hypothetical protein